jgi:cell division protein FtsB|tara:strand:- start:559 stop:780 length:222 start_codon:yes stop_codon:yes gene_type:complete
MTESGNWSNDSQSFTRMCILESQVESKDVQLATLKQENLILKIEVERLQSLVSTLSTKKDNINSNDDLLDRFK